MHGLAAITGSLLHLFPNKARDTTSRNLHHCFPDDREADIQRLVRSSLINTCCTAVEMGKTWLAPIDQTLSLLVYDQGFDEIRNAMANDKGVILMAPHLGNWELLGLLASNELPCSFMYQPPRISALDRLLREVRARNGAQLVPASRKGVAELLRALQRGELVGILPDQVPDEASGIFAPFFGQPAFTMTLVSRLVQRTGARVFCGYAERLPAGRGFRTVFLPAHEAIYSEDLLESVCGLNRSVEQAVNQVRAQYQWEYKRFRRQPDNSEFYRPNRQYTGQ